MIGHRPICTSQHHPGAQRRQLPTGAIEAEQGQRGHGGRKPGKGMNLATSPQNECENRRRRPSRGLAHTPGTPIFALFRWTNGLRVLLRFGFGEEQKDYAASYRSARAALEGQLPNDCKKLIRAHQLLRLHGKELCKRAQPICEACPLRARCHYASN